MPLHDFRCADCKGTREVWIPLDEAGTTELICLDCGGSMTKALSARVTLQMNSPDPASPASPASSGPGRKKSPTCTDGALRLTRPNPFAGSLPAERSGSGEQ
jgi:putative FmdB family regulatory protein